MALVVTGTTTLNSSFTETVTNGLITGSVGANVSYSKTWTNGSGADQVNYVFTKSATLAISTPVTLTLSALTDDSGRSIPFTKIRELVLKNNGTAVMHIGAAAANPWAAIVGDAATDKIPIRPGGVLMMVAPDVTGFAVSSGASDQLKLDPGATACPYELSLKGSG